MLSSVPPFYCPVCQGTIDINDSKLIRSYLNTKGFCPSKGCFFDLLKEVSKMTSAMNPMGFIYPLIGASLKWSREKLKKGLNQIILPKGDDEVLLYVNYTPSCSTVFAECRGNSPKLFKYSSGKVDMFLSQDCEMTVMSWAIKKEADDVWVRLMIEACEMFTLKNYSLLAVAANAACEHLSAKYFAGILKNRSVQYNDIEGFFKRGFTYGYQLNIGVSKLLKPILPAPVLDALKSLKKDRDKIAHGNELPENTLEQYATWIVASIFLKEYFKIAQPSCS